MTASVTSNEVPTNDLSPRIWSRPFGTEDYSPWPVTLNWHVGPEIHTAKRDRTIVAELHHEPREGVWSLWWYGLSSSGLSVRIGDWEHPNVAKEYVARLAQSARVSL